MQVLLIPRLCSRRVSLELVMRRPPVLDAYLTTRSIIPETSDQRNKRRISAVKVSVPARRIRCIPANGCCLILVPSKQVRETASQQPMQASAYFANNSKANPHKKELTKPMNATGGIVRCIVSVVSITIVALSGRGKGRSAQKNIAHLLAPHRNWQVCFFHALTQAEGGGARNRQGFRRSNLIYVKNLISQFKRFEKQKSGVVKSDTDLFHSLRSVDITVGNRKEAKRFPKRKTGRSWKNRL